MFPLSPNPPFSLHALSSISRTHTKIPNSASNSSPRMKRLFTGRSSKNLDAEPAKTASQPIAGCDKSRSKLPTAGYPLGEFDRQILGGFLEHCDYCTKSISNNSDVFMYGDLRAFCSAECRDKQIVRDQSWKGRHENPQGKK